MTHEARVRLELRKSLRTMEDVRSALIRARDLLDGEESAEIRRALDVVEQAILKIRRALEGLPPE